MRNLLVGLMISVSSMLVHAIRPTQMVVYCGELNAVLAVVHEYQEKLTWAGKEGDDAVMLWTNDDKNTYTIIKVRKDGVTCAISSGQTLPKV